MLLDKEGEGVAYEGLGCVYLKMGQFDSTITCLNNRLAIALALMDKKGESNAYGGLGRAYAGSSQFELAIVAFQKQWSLALELEDIETQDSAYLNLSKVCDNLVKFYVESGQTDNLNDLNHNCLMQQFRDLSLNPVTR